MYRLSETDVPVVTSIVEAENEISSFIMVFSAISLDEINLPLKWYITFDIQCHRTLTNIEKS